MTFSAEFLPGETILLEVIYISSCKCVYFNKDNNKREKSYNFTVSCTYSNCLWESMKYFEKLKVLFEL